MRRNRYWLNSTCCREQLHTSSTMMRVERRQQRTGTLRIEARHTHPLGPEEETRPAACAPCLELTSAARRVPTASARPTGGHTPPSASSPCWPRVCVAPSRISSDATAMPRLAVADEAARSRPGCRRAWQPRPRPAPDLVLSCTSSEAGVAMEG